MNRVRTPPRLRLSISKRLTLWYGLTLLILLSLFAFFCYASFHRSLHRDFDRHLTHEKMQILPFIRLDGPQPAFAPTSALRSVAYQTDGIYGTYVRLLTVDGGVLYRSPNFEKHDSLAVQLPESPIETAMSREWEAKPSRTIYTPLTGPQNVLLGWLEVTGYEWSLHQELHRLARTLLLGIIISVVFAIAGGFMLARRALRPVAALTGAANEIRATDLSARLPSRFGIQDELSDLADTFNAMIARLEASFTRERRFTANAAHELLTPLTTMRNGVEVALRRERDPAAYREVLRTLLVDIDEMSDTVHGLLQLAQAEGLNDLPRVPVELGRLVAEHVARFRERAQGQDQRLHVDVEPGVCVMADAGMLGEVVDNLIDNALKYTPQGGSIDVQVAAAGDEARLTVSDTGVGFEPEQASQVFDPFFRADTAEVQARAGSGLGLAIVETIVRAYGGVASARSSGRNKGSVFEIRLKLAPRDAC